MSRTAVGQTSRGESSLSRPDFWEKTLHNWQSEFLAVGSAKARSFMSEDVLVCVLEGGYMPMLKGPRI